MIQTPPILAAFVWPGLFAAGAASVGVPILIHLLARRRFKRIRWAAMEFLLDAEKKNRRRIRMEEWVLLALRCLALLLIALVVSRPFLRPQGLASLIGSSVRTERVFVLDDSYSMGYAADDGVVFDRARLAVHRLIDAVRQETPDDTVTLVRTSDAQTPVVTSAYLDDAAAEQLLARLEALGPSQESLALDGLIESLAKLLTDQPGLTAATVYFVSDFQRRDWIDRAAREPNRSSSADGSTPLRSRLGESDGSTLLRSRLGQTEGDGSGEGEAGPSSAPKPDAADLMAPLSAWARDGRSLQVVLINVGQADAANRGMVELTLASGQPVAGSSARVRAAAANHSDQPVEKLALSVSVGPSVPQETTVARVAARQRAAAEVDVEFVHSGYETIRAALPPDDLPIDDTRFAAVDVAAAVRVLLVNGEPSEDSFNDEVHLLRTALRPEGTVFSGNEVGVVDDAGLENARLDEFHVVVLANVYRVSEPTAEALESFVRAGGGMMVFLGDQVDADSWNAALFRDGEGVLSARLGETVQAPEAGARMQVVDRAHPVMAAVGREGDPLGVGRIAFGRYVQCNVDEPLEPARTNTGTPAASSGGADEVAPGRDVVDATGDEPRARVVAVFDDDRGSPAMVEREFGRGRAVLFASSADKEWNNWPDHPTFVPIMLEWTAHVARRALEADSVQVGEPIVFDLDAARYAPDVLVRSPAYPTELESLVSALAPEGGDPASLAVRWEHTGAAGVYQFVLHGLDGHEVTRMTAVNVDGDEGDLTAALYEELRQALEHTPFEYISGIDKLGGAGGGARTELWGAFLAAAMAVLMIEQGMAWRFGRKK